MAEPEAFALLAEVRAAAEREGGDFRDDVLAFDNVLRSDPSGFAFLAAHVVTIKFVGSAAAGIFLEKARVALQRILERSSIGISLHVGGGNPAKLSLRADIDKVSAALRDLPASDDGGDKD